KETNIYDSIFGIYRDFLIAKFKVLDQNNRILFDNTNLSDQDSKIEGGKFRKKDDRYSLNYHDKDICGLWGFITIYFTDHTKSRLQWNFYEGSNLITPDCLIIMQRYFLNRYQKTLF
ncbi:hypothetical protein OKE80_11000, partial [Riemerella anatipestifer]